jgi:hypothetical protein
MKQDLLTERIERLELENVKFRRSARISKLTLAALAGVVAMVATLPRASARTGGPSVLSALKINLVNPRGRVLASLGVTSDGTVLTFFDSLGQKTLTLGNNATESLAGLVTWDNNRVIPGTGVIRTAFGESNPNVGPSSGLGASVFDGSGKQRTGFGTTYDLASNDIFAIDSDGTTTGIGAFAATKFKGFFTNDSNGVNRQFGGLVFDSNLNENINEIGLSDTKGVVRVSAAQTPPDFVNPQNHRGNGFVVWDSNGLQQAGMAAFDDGSLAGFDIFDPNNVPRFTAFLTTQNGMNVDTFDANGNLTGHLP